MELCIELNVKQRQGGWFVKDDFESVDNAKEAIVNLPGISAKDLEKKLKWAYFHQYYSFRGIILTLKNVKSLGDLVHKSKMALKLLRQTIFGFRKRDKK